MSSLVGHTWKWIVAGLALVVLLVGLWAFEPWRVWTSSEVDEPLPSVAVADESKPVPGEPGPTTPVEPQLVELASGTFEDAEHGTSGTARVIELSDGRRFVRFEDLASSDGPDLHVWVTDRPSGGDWGSYDDGRYLELGELKATHGNQNYEIPDGADLGGLRSVVIWCDRFNVAFGTAPVAL
jgi:hypothetical protein